MRPMPLQLRPLVAPAWQAVSIIGTFLGAILLQALKVGLVVCGVDTFWQYIATGLIIVFAVYVDVIQGKLAAMRLNKKAKAE